MGNSKSTKADVVTQGMPQKERDLHLAVMGNDRESVRTLIAQGADINYPWNNPTVPSVKDSTTPLLAAVSLNHVDISLTYAACSKKIAWKRVRHGPASSVIFEYERRKPMILLKAGAGINRTDKRNCTPLYKAAYHGRPILVDFLVQAGADIDKADLESQTPLYICVQNAIVHSSYAAVERLLAAGASVNICDKSGKIPIHVAAHWKLKDMIRILLNANSNINAMDHKGRTPLFVCVSSLSTGLYYEDLKYQVPCIKVLYAAGCDMLNLVDWLKWKGPGIPADMLADDDSFHQWYKTNMNSPHSLMNLCRKSIQQQVCYHDNFVKLIPKLPVPPKLQTYLSRKMFHLPKP